MAKKKCKEFDLITPRSMEEAIEHIGHKVCHVMLSSELFYDMATRIIQLEEELNGC